MDFLNQTFEKALYNSLATELTFEEFHELTSEMGYVPMNPYDVEVVAGMVPFAGDDDSNFDIGDHMFSSTKCKKTFVQTRDNKTELHVDVGLLGQPSIKYDRFYQDMGPMDELVTFAMAPLGCGDIRQFDRAMNHKFKSPEQYNDYPDYLVSKLEHLAFDSDLFTGKDVVFLNPSRGTIKRSQDHINTVGVSFVATEKFRQTDYFSTVVDIAKEKGVVLHNYEDFVADINNDDFVLYTGFTPNPETRGHKYFGFEFNPYSLYANKQGLVLSVVKSKKATYRIDYMRSKWVETLLYDSNPNYYRLTVPATNVLIRNSTPIRDLYYLVSNDINCYVGRVIPKAHKENVHYLMPDPIIMYEGLEVEQLMKDGLLYNVTKNGELYCDVDHGAQPVSRLRFLANSDKQIRYHENLNINKKIYYFYEHPVNGYRDYKVVHQKFGRVRNIRFSRNAPDEPFERCEFDECRTIVVGPYGYNKFPQRNAFDCHYDIFVSIDKSKMTGHAMVSERFKIDFPDVEITSVADDLAIVRENIGGPFRYVGAEGPEGKSLGKEFLGRTEFRDFMTRTAEKYEFSLIDVYASVKSTPYVIAPDMTQLDEFDPNAIEIMLM